MRLKLLFFFLFLSNVLFSQSISRSLINNTGNTLSNSEFSISYSLGQPIVGKINNSDYLLRQGFQQPPFCDEGDTVYITISSCDNYVSSLGTFNYTGIYTF